MEIEDMSYAQLDDMERRVNKMIQETRNDNTMPEGIKSYALRQLDQYLALIESSREVLRAKEELKEAEAELEKRRRRRRRWGLRG